MAALTEQPAQAPGAKPSGAQIPRTMPRRSLPCRWSSARGRCRTRSCGFRYRRRHPRGGEPRRHCRPPALRDRRRHLSELSGVTPDIALYSFVIITYCIMNRLQYVRCIATGEASVGRTEIGLNYAVCKRHHKDTAPKIQGATRLWSPTNVLPARPEAAGGGGLLSFVRRHARRN